MAENDEPGSPLEVNFKEITLLEEVGRGSYGKVYKAEWREKIVAVKEFDMISDIRTIDIEKKQLSRAKHENIIVLHATSKHLQSEYLIMNYAEGGSLHTFLHGAVKPYYTTAHGMSWVRQCANGVLYLHSMSPKPLIHRDLKPLNLLLSNEGRHLKICDFGTVVDQKTCMTNNKGSASWMAPEVFEGSNYTEKCDIFSWAIVLWEVLSREQPFKDIDNSYSIMWKIHKGVRPPLIKDCPELILNLMKSCWACLPENRPSMQSVVNRLNGPELAPLFIGCDKPLKYKFEKGIILRTDSEDHLGDYTIDFSSYYSYNNNTNSSLTPTNSYDYSTNTTPTNSNSNLNENFNYNMPTASITASTRWDVIPEESETSLFANEGNDTVFVPNSINGRIGMDFMHQIRQPLAPLKVNVDPNAWDLNRYNNEPCNAKSDSKERLTVTDARPFIASNAEIPSNTSFVSTTSPPPPPPPLTTTTTTNDNRFINQTLTTSTLDNTNEMLTNENEFVHSSGDENYEQSLADTLDPEYQPEKPLQNNALSQHIYNEHRRLTNEYLSTDTKLFYVRDFKKMFMLQMDPIERQDKKEILKKMHEKQELLELFNQLKEQIKNGCSGANVADAMISSTNSSNSNTQSNNYDRASDEGWVFVTPGQNT